MAPPVPPHTERQAAGSARTHPARLRRPLSVGVRPSLGARRAQQHAQADVAREPVVVAWHLSVAVRRRRQRVDGRALRLGAPAKGWGKDGGRMVDGWPLWPLGACMQQASCQPASQPAGQASRHAGKRRARQGAALELAHFTASAHTRCQCWCSGNGGSLVTTAAPQCTAACAGGKGGSSRSDGRQWLGRRSCSAGPATPRAWRHQMIHSRAPSRCLPLAHTFLAPVNSSSAAAPEASCSARCSGICRGKAGHDQSAAGAGWPAWVGPQAKLASAARTACLLARCCLVRPALCRLLATGKCLTRPALRGAGAQRNAHPPVSHGSPAGAAPDPCTAGAAGWL